MALVVGSVNAEAGMSKAIYDEIDRLLSPPLQRAVDAASGDAKIKAQEALNGARDGWKKLAFAISTGVVTHIVANMEITGVTTRGSISAAVSGATTATPPGPHTHPVSLTATQNDVTFSQSNNGTGRVK
jgi:hypothetical protein